MIEKAWFSDAGGMNGGVAGMRILHVTDNLRVGGVQSVLVNLANIQVSRGHRVGIVAGPGPLWDEVDSRVRRVETRTGRLAVLRARARLLRELLCRWDVVHTHQRGVSSFTWMIKHVRRFRHVEHVHSIFLPISHRRISFRGDALIACGDAVGEMLTSHYGRSSARVHVVSNGSPDHGYRSRSAPPAGGPSRIVNIGRVCAEKDPERFIRVVRAVRDLGFDAEALWIGGGELLESARHSVRNAGLIDVVKFCGPMRPAAHNFRDADVYLSTSRTEGLPLALIEAAAAGLPLVATDVGSVREVVRDGRNGYLVEPSATDREMAVLIGELLGNDELREQLGSRSRKIFEDHFALSKFATCVEVVYLADRQ